MVKQLTEIVNLRKKLTETVRSWELSATGVVLSTFWLMESNILHSTLIWTGKCWFHTTVLDSDNSVFYLVLFAVSTFCVFKASKIWNLNRRMR